MYIHVYVSQPWIDWLVDVVIVCGMYIMYIVVCAI